MKCPQIKPAKMIICKGQITLKLAAQICAFIELIVAICFALVFLILDSFVWLPYTCLYIAEMLYCIIYITDVFSNATCGAVFVRILFAIFSWTSIGIFIAFRDFFISWNMRGQGLTWHYFLFRVLFDIPTTFFNWSFYRQRLLLEARLK